MLRDWADLEDWVRRETEYEVAHDALTPTLAVSFVDTSPDLIVGAPMLLVETADESSRHSSTGLADCVPTDSR